MSASNFEIYKKAKKIWVVSDGTKGMEIQSIGLAERMGIAPKILRLTPPILIRRLPRLYRLWNRLPLPQVIDDAVKKEGWPDIIITTGRRMAGLSIHLRAKSKGMSKTIHIQDPKLPPNLFDTLIIPSHDTLRGENVILSLGSLSSLTPSKISEKSKSLPPEIGQLPLPRIAVLVGGSNRRYSVHEADFIRLGQYLNALAHATNSSLAIIPSRRSHKDAPKYIESQMGADLINRPEYWIWDGRTENPYPGILEMVDAVIVTSDSVNMTCEACSSGKPVYRYDFKQEKGRIALFHQMLEQGGFTRPLEPIDTASFPGTPPPHLDETGRIAALLMGRA